MRDTSLMEGITKEDCICIEGVMDHRDEETYNPKIPTGTVELEAHKVTILGKVYRQLPFEIQTSKETSRRCAFEIQISGSEKSKSSETI